MSRYLLQATTSGLCLADSFIDQHPILIDFTSGQFNYRMKKSGRRREMLAKAVGVKDRTNVLDCTAGLGRDTFLLASLGCRVTMIEPVSYTHLRAHETREDRGFRGGG